MRTFVYINIILFVFIVSFSAHSQAPQAFFKVEGEVLKSLTLTRDDLTRMFKQDRIAAKDKGGKEHVFKGVNLAAILDSAGVTLGSQLRGENLAKCILVQASDGYEVVFSLAEVDPGFSNQTILIAYEVDGTPLPKGEGPFRIIAPNDKRHARWIREIATIKVLFSK
jgi:DMSO/TMAO reductase YedYZ molybdopterin-dependent catalytic subunit